MAKRRFTRVSSAFALITYDDETNECVMTFTDGKSYTIQQMPQREFERWMSSDSRGEYFNFYIRGNY